MADYWKMYALLHVAVLEAIETLKPCDPAYLVLKESVEDVEEVFFQTRDTGEEA